MTAAPAAAIDVEEIDLDTLTLEELLHERTEVRAAILEISTQLMNQPWRPATPEDESPAWVEYRDWRRRARIALKYRRQELDQIKEMLVVRNHERSVANKLYRATLPPPSPPSPESVCHTPEEYATLRASAITRRAALLESLNAEGAPEMLALRLYRALRHLIGHADSFPVELDEDDIEAMREASIFLRSRFTSSGVRDFVDGRLSESRP